MTEWLAVISITILATISPGPDFAMVSRNALSLSRRAGMMTALGIGLGVLVHVSYTLLGIGVLIRESPGLFNILKLLGAAYLVWLGIQKWRAPVIPVDANAPAVRRRGLFLQGVLVNLTNPKAIIFIAALVPQFVNPALPQIPQYLLIALTLCLTDLTVMSGYALAASRLGSWLHDPLAIRLQNRAFGGLFVSAGALLAISSRPS